MAKRREVAQFEITPITADYRACIVLAVTNNVQALIHADATLYDQWTEQRWDDPAWSEGMVHRIPGVTVPAFVSVCQKIAALALHPGGVRMFSTHFEAKRDPHWCGWWVWQARAAEAWAVIGERYQSAVEASAQPAPRKREKRGKR